MPTWPEISRSIYGTWRLAHADTGGMNYFDLSFGAIPADQHPGRVR